MSPTNKGIFLSVGIGLMSLGAAVAQKAASPFIFEEFMSGVGLLIIGVGLIFLREKLKEG